LTTISKYAFQSCGLESVEFKDGIITIESNAFMNTSIKEIKLPNSIRSLGKGVFASCTQLSTVDLGDGIEKMAEYVFGDNENLTEIIIPKSIKQIYSTTFMRINNLSSIKFEGDAPEMLLSGTESVPFTIYYHEGAKGFTTPEWHGYKIEIW
jgi:hypothetical protein